MGFSTAQPWMISRTPYPLTITCGHTFLREPWGLCPAKDRRSDGPSPPSACQPEIRSLLGRGQSGSYVCRLG
jgi:hypothetical protein